MPDENSRYYGGREWHPYVFSLNELYVDGWASSMTLHATTTSPGTKAKDDIDVWMDKMNIKDLNKAKEIRLNFDIYERDTHERLVKSTKGEFYIN